MTRRLPAPPPGDAPGPRNLPDRGPESAPDAPDEDDPAPDAEPWDDLAEDEALVMAEVSAEVSDDPDDGDMVDDPDPRDLDDLGPLDAAEDDDLDVGSLDVGMEDELGELAAPEENELPILSYHPRVQIDGVSITGRIDPSSPVTVWAGAPFHGIRSVVVEVGGARIQANVRGTVGGPEIVLGRDVLGGRFLLRL